MAGKITTVLAKKEAEAYRSQGLHREAVKLYKELLATSPNINPEIRAALESRLHGLKEEMTHAAQHRHKSLTPSEIACIRDGWGDKATEIDALVCAQAFAQVGAHTEALTELRKLLARGRLKKIYLAAAADCFVQLHAPEIVADAIEQWTQATGHPLKTILAMQLAMAKHMASRQHLHHALALFRHLHRIPSLAAAMQANIDDLTTRLTQS